MLRSRLTKPLSVARNATNTPPRSCVLVVAQSARLPSVGMRDRETHRIQTQVEADTTKDTSQGFVVRRTTEDSTVYTDEARAYIGLPRDHARVNDAIGERVNDKASTNEIESH